MSPLLGNQQTALNGTRLSVEENAMTCNGRKGRAAWTRKNESLQRRKVRIIVGTLSTTFLSLRANLVFDEAKGEGQTTNNRRGGYIVDNTSYLRFFYGRHL